MFNSTRNDAYYNNDILPPSYEDDDFDSSSIRFNRSYYDDFLSNHNHSFNKTTSSSYSSPFTFLILILVSYLILTIILLIFSLYKQRRMEIENFYFGDTEEEIERAKRFLAWKKFLIRKIRKGDMEPLLINRSFDSKAFPLQIV